MADLAVWQRTIVDEEGNVVPGAEIEVRREEDGSLATLYADRAGETPLANPLAADMSGFVRFFAQGDAYTITAVGAGSTRTWRFDPTGRLQEFDRVSEALVADDAADLLSARANLGTFSSTADVQNSHIPAVLDSIRTNGYYSPGDGGGALYKREASEPSHAGKIQSADGAWWELSSERPNVKMFGAVGDGVADDTDAFNSALRSPYRSNLHVPKGVYRVSAYLRLHSQTRLFLSDDAVIERRAIAGDGPSYGFLNIDYGDDETGAYDADGDIHITGGVLRYTNDSDNGIPFGITHCEGFHLRDIEISNWRNRHAIDLCGVRNATFKRVRFRDPNYVDGGDLDLHEALQIDAATSSAFPPGGLADLTPCEDVLVSECLFENVATAVGTHHSASVRHRDIKVIHNRMINLSSEGMRCRHWQDSVITGNYIENSGRRALWVGQCVSVTINNNVIVDASEQSAGSYSAVFLNNSVDCTFGGGNVVTSYTSPKYKYALEIGSSGNPSQNTVADIGGLTAGTLGVLSDNGQGSRIAGLAGQGSDANGWYVKHQNGLMECWFHTGGAASGTWTFPGGGFATTKGLCVVGTSVTGITDEARTVQLSSITTTSVDWLHKNNNGANRAHGSWLRAVGFWRA